MDAPESDPVTVYQNAIDATWRFQQDAWRKFLTGVVDLRGKTDSWRLEEQIDGINQRFTELTRIISDVSKGFSLKDNFQLALDEGKALKNMLENWERDWLPHLEVSPEQRSTMSPAAVLPELRQLLGQLSGGLQYFSDLEASSAAGVAGHSGSGSAQTLSPVGDLGGALEGGTGVAGESLQVSWLTQLPLWEQLISYLQGISELRDGDDVPAASQSFMLAYEEFSYSLTNMWRANSSDNVMRVIAEGTLLLAHLRGLQNLDTSQVPVMARLMTDLEKQFRHFLAELETAGHEAEDLRSSSINELAGIPAGRLGEIFAEFFGPDLIFNLNAYQAESDAEVPAYSQGMQDHVVHYLKDMRELIDRQQSVPVGEVLTWGQSLRELLSGIPDEDMTLSELSGWEVVEKKGRRETAIEDLSNRNYIHGQLVAAQEATANFLARIHQEFL